VNRGLVVDNLDGRPGPMDLMVVTGQLHRSARDITGVAVRCPFGYPAVVETAPTLGDAPNPTLLYLTCPTMVTAVSRAEAAGGVREFRAWAAVDEEARQTLEEITLWYKRRRAFLTGGQSLQTRPDAGIGGPEGPEKASCLHAYAAAFLAVMSGWLPDRLTDESVEQGCPGGSNAAEHPGVTTNPHAVRGPAESPSPAMRGAHEVTVGSPSVGSKTGLDAPFEAERVSTDAISTCVAQRIWAQFLPPVEEMWCGDGRCARLGP
jgi:hypothetical protein